MKYMLVKECWNGNWLCNRPPEPADICSTLGEAMECFKDSFRHLLSRKPTAKQIEKARRQKEVTAKSGNLRYVFQICGER